MANPLWKFYLFSLLSLEGLSKTCEIFGAGIKLVLNHFFVASDFSEYFKSESSKTALGKKDCYKI